MTRARKPFAGALPVPDLTDAVLEEIASRAVMGPNGCWVWVGTRFVDTGYARIRIGRRDVRVHRVMCHHFNGGVPQHLVVDHLCRNTACINPAHLEAVEVGVNTERGINQKVRSQRQTHCKHGHEYTPENTLMQNGRSGNKTRACRRCHTLREQQRRERINA